MTGSPAAGSDAPWRVAWGEVTPGTDRRAVAWLLLEELLPGATLTNPCPRCGGPHGPVRVHGVDAAASVTYAGGYAIVAAAPQVSALGIDAEPAPPGEKAAGRDAAGLARVLGPGAGLRDWVRVEAVLKADGRGLRFDPGRVRVIMNGDRGAARLAGTDASFAVRDVPGPPGTLVSLAFRPR